jgi:hypothetical protein
MKTYTIEQFQAIQSSYVLPELITNIISNLSKELGVLNLPSTSSHSFSKTDSRFSTESTIFRKSRTEQQAMSKQWEKAKPFKATVIDKKEGIDKCINEIRICLNKISNKNYDTQKEQIIQHLEGLRAEINDDTELFDSSQRRVATAIFDIASANKFYSVLYAVLYKELNERFSIFKEIIGEFINQYLENIHTIEFVDPNVDYDKYCLHTKENDKRKAMTVFIVNLMKNGILESAHVLRIIYQLQEMMMTFIDTSNKLNEVEEIMENIFLFITTAKDDFTNENEEWRTLLEKVKLCSQMKSKEHLSLSSRVVFKNMDILDKMK